MPPDVNTNSIQLSLTNQGQAPIGTNERIKEQKKRSMAPYLEPVLGGDQTAGQPLCMRHRVLQSCLHVAPRHANGRCRLIDHLHGGRGKG
jgi:hypothetical protein